MAAIAHDLLGSEELARNGRSARTLAKSKGMTAVLTAVRAGGEIHEHAAPGPVVIVPVTGAVTVEGLKNRQSLTLGSGRTLFIGQGEKHLVSAAEDAEKQETVPAGRGVGVVGDGNTAGVGSPPQQIPGLVSDRPPKTGLRPCSGSFLTPVMLGIVSLASY